MMHGVVGSRRGGLCSAFPLLCVVGGVRVRGPPTWLGRYREERRGRRVKKKGGKKAKANKDPSSLIALPHSSRLLFSSWGRSRDLA